MGAYLYLTFRCNLNCAYCDGGSGVRFPQMSCPELPLSGWEKILQALVPHTDVLMLSGGEPLLYPDLPGLLHYARRIGFHFISLNTNGLLLTEPIIDEVDAIIISLDSLDRKKSDRIWNRSGATDQVMNSIDAVARRRHPSLMINSVIMPDNIDDIGEILDFCRKREITFSTGPALVRARPIPGLQGNPRYEALIDKVLGAKKSGQRIAATVDYLQSVKTFRSFDCHPLLLWRVYPNGDLVFPCSRLNRLAGNLLPTPDPSARKGLLQTDPIALFRAAANGDFFTVECGENCPLSCYMDPSFMLKRPLSILREGLYRARTFTSGHRLVF